jgi:hypothetical protein
MANKVAGIAFIKVDGRLLPLRGNFTVSPSPIERTGIAGQDAVHGFSELPRVPYIEGDITLDPSIETEEIESQNNVTVTAELANGHTYVLSQAWCKAALDLNTHDGMTRVRWEGVRCVELAGFTTTTAGVTFTGPGAP